MEPKLEERVIDKIDLLFGTKTAYESLNVWLKFTNNQ